MVFDLAFSVIIKLREWDVTNESLLLDISENHSDQFHFTFHRVAPNPWTILRYKVRIPQPLPAHIARHSLHLINGVGLTVVVATGEFTNVTT